MSQIALKLSSRPNHAHEKENKKGLARDSYFNERRHTKQPT
jgi:hypothetical protein